MSPFFSCPANPGRGTAKPKACGWRGRLAPALLAPFLLAACGTERNLAAGDLPKVRPGQWAFTGETRNVPSAGKVCLKSFADALGRWYPGCRPFAYSLRGDAVVVRSHCVNPDGTKVDSRMIFRGDYATAFSMDDRIVILSRTLVVPPTDVRIRYRYVGPTCARPSPGG